MNSYAYLDHNATTTLRPEAREAMMAALALTANPSSVHGPGRDARKMLEAARSQVAALVGAARSDVIFTSGGTEANNLAIQGCGRQRVLVSAIEHPSVLNCGGEIIPVDGDGIVDLESLDMMLSADDRPALVSVMLANNETGVIEPIAQVVEIAHRHGALVHCDAVQAAGKITIDIGDLGVDMLTLSGHKIGGPSGVGALIVDGLDTRQDMNLRATGFGGGHERGFRAGTENLAGIAGFGAAASCAPEMIADVARIRGMRDRLEAAVRAIEPDVEIFAEGTARLGNTSCLTMPGSESSTQLMSFDLAEIGVSAGSACSSGKVKTSGVLKAMGVDTDRAGTAVRVSLGWPNEDRDVDSFISAWAELYDRVNESYGNSKLSKPAA